MYASASAGYCQGLADIEKKLLFFPSKPLIGTPADIGLAFDEVSLEAADKGKLHAWWVPCDRARGTLILSHGNGGNISHRMEKLKIFHDLGLSVLLYDYRGYGKSQGKPSETGVYADAQAAYDFVVNDKKIPALQIISCGESLGGSIAARLASKNSVGLLILDSSFSSLKDIAKVHYPLVQWLVQSKFDTLGAVRSVKAPVLVLHSRNDEVVPFAQGKRLFDAANPPKEFVELTGDHNSGFLRSKTKYVNAIAAFLNRHLGPSSPPSNRAAAAWRKRGDGARE
jgi:fermentation-respiration switch protein FrsA (DUF1100 family)